MQLDEAIRSRRTVRQFRPDPVDRTLIDEIIELATWAPNHRHVEPWRFYVATGAAKEPLCAIHRDLTREERPEEPERAEARYQELMGVPVYIVVTVEGDPIPKRDLENYAAVCCAIQNLLLAAHGRGLGAVWRSGNVIRDARTRAWLGLPEHERIVGLIQVGYPVAPPPAVARAPVAAKTVFLEG
ncbi:MAG: hypothetical protein K0R39_4214 [Symbiobacteriaceae bacterium]|jgi:nitroreductase|nr:hypothetical protein [Symbiobacteriaceae bacterium]